MTLTFDACFYFYLIITNLISGVVFAYDKRAAIKNRRRIPELTLHLLEILGGALANLLLMYTLRHKNRKFSYWVWTWLVATGWVILFSFKIIL